MAGVVLGIAQQKGGAGKTTLAVQLGVAWSAQGQRVAMLDIDPQASLLAWFDLRRQRLGDDATGLIVQSFSGWRLGTELRRFRQEFDIVVVDSPPHAESDAKAAVRHADLALLPCQPSRLDVWATFRSLEFIAGEKSRALMVLNRVPSRGRTAAAVRAEIDANGWPLASTTLGNRQAFAASIGEGRGVVETAPKSPAGQEVVALAAEIMAELD